MGNGCTKPITKQKKPARRFLKKSPDCPKHEVVLIDPVADSELYKCHLCGNVIIPQESRYHCQNCNRDECRICFKQTEKVVVNHNKEEIKV